MTTKHLLAALPLVLLAACVPAPEPTPAPTPTPTPTPTPVVQAPPPFAGNWIDAPVTPGDWSYAAGTARFGDAVSGTQLTLRCDRATSAIEIARAGSATGSALIVRTETQERSLGAAAAAAPLPAIVARVGARDTLLDAMAFSRGRFAVEADGLPTLYIPSWPEVTRVIEDCR